MSRYLLVASLAASHLPFEALAGVIPRDAPSVTSQSIQSLTQTAISIYLGSQNTADKGFFALEGWKTIDFAGANTAVDNNTANSIIFQTADALPSRGAANSTGGDIFFSDEYVNYIQEVNKALARNDSEPNPDIQKAQDAQTKACFEDAPAALTKALEVYISSTGMTPSNKSDPAFVSWASTGYAPYSTANTACQSATNDYFAEIDKINGDDFAIFSTASNNVRGLTSSPPASHPGVNMPIDKALPGSPSTVQGNFVPMYSIPVLQGTLAGWQSLAPTSPAYTYDSEKNTFSDDTSTSFGGAHLGFAWGRASLDASASHSDSTSVINTTAQNFQLSFNGLALMDVERGVWFDGFRSANALHNPADNVTAAAKPVFDKFFKTSDNPGPAAIYNEKALVAFQPSWTIEFTASNFYNNFKQSQASASGCFLFICGGGEGGSSSNVTKYDDSKNSVTFTDQTNNGYIIGYVQHNFWAD
ncbi:hypothetical protein B0H10DRAFT_1772754 [Mycena sp. CBHHK59/15]|nr:hypothetical protein B0H10DRAFT_1772754 [Mycena sp. CBHHK59/15]